MELVIYHKLDPARALYIGQAETRFRGSVSILNENHIHLIYCSAMSSSVSASASPDPCFDVEQLASPLPGTSTPPSSPPTQGSEFDFHSRGVSSFHVCQRSTLLKGL